MSGSLNENGHANKNGTVESEKNLCDFHRLIESEKSVDSVLHLDKIHVKDVSKVEKLIDQLVSCGPDALQVITDFDATLSRYTLDGKRCETSYGLITNSRFTSEDIKAIAGELFAKYHPYESNLLIPTEERVKKLGEWYDLKHENYLKSSVKITAADIRDLVKKANVPLREGSQQVIRKLNSANVPTLIFSAGSGNSVEEILKLNNVDAPTVKVIANFMEFDEKTGEIIGFKKPTVHPGNKNETAVHETHADYFESLKSRKNAIVIGDNIGDADMATGMPTPNALFKVGFLNYKVEEQLEAFKEAFDVVLVHDPTFHFVDALVDLILNKMDPKST